MQPVRSLHAPVARRYAQRLEWDRLVNLRAAASDDSDAGEDAMLAPCNPAFVVADNESHPHYSQLTIDVSGLKRRDQEPD